MVILPGAWSCLIPNVFNYANAKLSVQKSVLFYPLYILVLYRALNYGFCFTLVILVKKGSCMTKGYFYFVYTTSNSTKSAPWYSAASNAYNVFSGKIEQSPRWAIFRGRLLAFIYYARFGKLKTVCITKIMRINLSI